MLPNRLGRVHGRIQILLGWIGLIGWVTESISAAGTFLNIDFASAEPWHGMAATGNTDADYWNNYWVTPGLPSGQLLDLRFSDGTFAGGSLAVVNGPGFWGNGHSNPMMYGYLYTYGPGTISLAFSNISAGVYNLFVYAHGGPPNDQNSIVSVESDGVIHGPKSTTTSASWLSVDWIEGAQYVLFENVVVSPRAPLVVRCDPGASGYAFVNGLQLRLMSPAQTEEVAPRVLGHQGRVTVGGVPFHGTGLFKFALVNGTGSEIYWGSAADILPKDGQPDTAENVSVNRGLYSVILGGQTMPALAPSMLAHPEVRLRVWFSDGTNGFELLAPDQKLGSVPYAFLAQKAETATVASVAVSVTPGGVSQLGTPNGANPIALQLGNSGTVTIGASTASPEVADTRLRIVGGRVVVDHNFGFFSLNQSGSGIGAGLGTGADDSLFLVAGGSGSKLYISPSGDVGIGTSNPAEKLHLAGAIVVANNANPVPKAGTIRWTGRDFEGFNGSRWVSLSSDPTAVTPRAGMLWIRAGSFAMGSPDFETDHKAEESPQTSATISQGFWMGSREVTQEEYQAVVGSNPSHFTGDLSRPVEMVNWDNAVDYCERLTTNERLAGRIPGNWEYRLPTEAEWEYSARTGTATRFSYGDDLPAYGNLANYAWYESNSGGTTHATGGRAPNAWGLFDMYGNVREWCQDLMGTYPGGQVTNPQGSASGSSRVTRGGSWEHDGEHGRSARRDSELPVNAFSNLGFRVVLAPNRW